MTTIYQADSVRSTINTGLTKVIAAQVHRFEITAEQADDGSWFANWARGGSTTCGHETAEEAVQAATANAVRMGGFTEYEAARTAANAEAQARAKGKQVVLL